MNDTRVYRFALTIEGAEDDPNADDSEWFADAAWGAMTTFYGVRCTYGNIEEVEADDAGQS